MAAEFAEYHPTFEEIDAQAELDSDIVVARGRLLTVFTEPQRSLERVIKRRSPQQRMKERVQITLESGVRLAARQLEEGIRDAELFLEGKIADAESYVHWEMELIEFDNRDFLHEDRNQ